MDASAQDVEDFLSFKDFTNVHGQSDNPTPAQINVNSPEKNVRGRDHLQDLIYDMSTSTNPLDGNSGNNPVLGIEEEGNKKNLSIFSLEYYQQYFNVDTYIVLDRIACSIIPKRAPGNYLKFVIEQNPDLYGPFWIAITLIFSIAISGNIANYLSHANEKYHWHYNFHLVSYAATAIYIYAFFVPIALWGLLKYSLMPVDNGYETESANYTPSLISIMCVYGYSLSIYIPVSILWVIQISILQWLLVITAAFLSGTSLVIILTPALRNSNISFLIVFGILAAHFLLAAGFMLYFFHMPTPPKEAELPKIIQSLITPAPVIPANLIQKTVVSTSASFLNTTG